MYAFFVHKYGNKRYRMYTGTTSKTSLISLRIDDRHSGKANIPPSALSFNLMQI